MRHGDHPAARCRARGLVSLHRFRRKGASPSWAVQREIGRGIKFQVACGEWRAERKDLVFVSMVECVFDAVGVSGSGLKDENSQEEKADFAIHGNGKCKRGCVSLGGFSLALRLRLRAGLRQCGICGKGRL
jgi:hypothetical protein